MLNLRQERNAFGETEGPEHSASAEAVLEVINSLKGGTDSGTKRTLATLEVVRWMV